MRIQLYAHVCGTCIFRLHGLRYAQPQKKKTLTSRARATPDSSMAKVRPHFHAARHAGLRLCGSVQHASLGCGECGTAKKGMGYLDCLETASQQLKNTF